MKWLKIKFILMLVMLMGSLGGHAEDVKSQETSTPKKEVINQVLFSEGSQSWTSRDLGLYKKVINTYLKQEKISEYSDSLVEDFLMSRLLKREALLFEIKPQANLSDVSSKLPPGDYSKSEIEAELNDLSYAVALLNLKEKQMGQKLRFKAWIDVLKRKYQVKMKSSEITIN